MGGYLNSLADAYLEAMSGFTSTGATVFDDVERLPHGILFWRSLMQWVGGLGIVFFIAFAGGWLRKGFLRGEQRPVARQAPSSPFHYGEMDMVYLCYVDCCVYGGLLARWDVVFR